MRLQSQRLINNIGLRFLSLSFVVLIFLGGIIFVQARAALIDSTYEKLQIAATIEEDEIKLWFRKEEASLLLISQFSEISTDVAALLDLQSAIQERVSEETTMSDRFKLTLQLSDLLESILQFKANWLDISILDLTGSVIYSTDSQLEGKTLTDSELTYFDPSISRNAIKPIFYLSKITNQPTVTLGVPLYKERQPIAIIATNLNLKELDKIVRQQTSFGISGVIYLVSLLGEKTTTIDAQQLISRDNRFLVKNNQQKIYLNHQDILVIGAYHPIQQDDILILAEISQEEALFPARQLAIRIIVFGIISIAFLYWGIRGLIKKLHQARRLQEQQNKQLQQEIYERNQIARDLVRGNAILTAQQETSIDGILILDEQQKIVSYNRRFIELWKIKGQFPIGLDGSKLLAYLIDDSQKAIESFLDNSVNSKHREIILKDNRIFEVYSNAIDTQQKNYGIIFYFRDITRRKKAEKRKNYASEALKHHLRRANLLAKITKQIRSNLQSYEVFHATVNSIGKTFKVSRCHLMTCKNINEFLSRKSDLAFSESLRGQLSLAQGDRIGFELENIPYSQIVAEYCVADYFPLIEAQIPLEPNLYLQQVLTQDKAIATTNVYQEPLLANQRQLCYQIELKSLLAIATSYQGKLNGCLVLHQCDYYRQWESEEIKLFQTVADSVGIALAQAQMLELEIARTVQLDRQNKELQAQIGERQAVEQALSEKSLAIEASHDGMAILENDHFLYVNWAYVELFGYDSASELIGQPWSILHSSEEIIRYQIETMPFLLQQGYWNGETVAIRKDGSYFDEEISFNFIKEGKLICVCRNITERKRVERTLEKQLQRELLLSQITYEIRQNLDSQVIFQTAAIQIGRTFKADRCLIYTYETDPEPYIAVVAEYLTPECDTLLGLKLTVRDNPYVAALLKRDIAIATPNVYESALFAPIVPLCQKIRLKSKLAIRTSYQGKSNGCIGLQQCDEYRQWTHEEIVLLEAVAAQLGIAIAQSQLLEKEQQQRQELEIAKQKAEVANLAKSEFLAKMTHELRTPLNAILGFTQLMYREASTTPEQKETLCIINSSGEHLLSLISSVLEMSKIEAGKTTIHLIDCDLYRLLDSLWGMLHPKAQSKGLELIFDFAVNLPLYIKIDEGKLRQILINLLSNAIKFTDRGTITLQVTSQPLKVTNCPYERALFFTVIDTGVGIAPEELNSLFQAFQQTKSGKRSGEGTGLGLTISQRFIQMMDGRISVESQINRGTKFEVMIPVQIGNSQQVRDLKAQQRQVVSLAERANYKILIVEDRQENRQILNRLLTSVGFITHEATNGQEAIIHTRTWQPDLILMDVKMPILNGDIATQKIKQEMKNKSPIIIALTASAFDEDRQKMLLAGCDDFITKPFQAETLFATIADRLNIEYIYQKPLEINSNNNELSFSEIKSQLSQMPQEWQEQMHRSAIALDEAIVLQLIAQIPDSAHYLTDTLEKWLADFRFDKIAQLLE